MIFDVGSSSVGAALSWLGGEGPPRIIQSVREPIVLEEKTEFERFLTLTAKALEVVAEKISKSGLGAPQKVFCILSSPWYVSQTRVITIEKNTPLLFTEKIAKGLVDKEITLFEEEYRAKYAHPQEKIRTLEVRTIRTSLNGYETPHPFHQRAKQFEMTIFISISPEAVLARFEEAVRKYFHARKINFASFVMASFIVARDVFSHEENFLLIDLGGEVTDISLIKKNTLMGSISYPAGTNFIVRRVAEGIGVTLPEAISAISLYKDGHAAGTIAKKLDPVMAELKKQWLSKFQESLANLTNDISIPSKIFMAVDREYADFFTAIIKTEQFNQYTLTDSKFEIAFLGSEALSGTTLFGEGVPRDPFIIIEVICIDRFFH